MNVSNKVALFALLPATGILIYGLAAIFIYQTTIEAKVSIVSSIATSVTLLFLISERLRESARQKMEFLNKRALTPALKVGRDGIVSAHEGEAIVLQQCSELLKHNGTFLKVTLYPKDLIATLDTAKDSMFAYDKPYQKLLAMGYKTFGQGQFSILALLAALEILSKRGYQDRTLTTATKNLESLRTTDPKIVEEFTRKGKKAASDMGQIKKQIEEFLVDNQL